MKRYVGSIYGRANVPENVWAVLGWVHAQTWIKMIRSSVIYIIDTRSDHPYPYLGVYSSKYRPNTLPPNSIIFSFSLWSKAMTLRLHRRKSGWLHSNGVWGTYSRKKSFTWFATLAWAGWVDCSLPGHEEEEQGRGRRRGFLLPISKKGVPMIMEPLVYLLVTATTLTRHLAYLRQAMAMLHVVYASISILLDMEVRG